MLWFSDSQTLQHDRCGRETSAFQFRCKTRKSTTQIGMLKQIRKQNKHGTETENSDRKRVRKPKKVDFACDSEPQYEEVDDTYSVAGIDDEEEYVDESVKAPSQDDESMYCFCQQKATEDMICCDNPKCPYKWFHYRCVGLTPDSITDGLWYCPICKSHYST